MRIEDVKTAGLAVDVDLLAQNGFESISEDDRYRLKTQGVCAQRQVGVFMLRIRVPGGAATVAQIRAVADLAERYAAPSLHVTTRGGLELHHVEIQNVRAIWNGLEAVGLTTKGTCGDTIRKRRRVRARGGVRRRSAEPRSVCPPAARPYRGDQRHDEHFPEDERCAGVFAACDHHVATSDIGFVATPAATPGAAPTFTLWGAGGLGAAPRLAIELRRGLAQGDLLTAFDAVVAIGKKYGDRGNRAKAKIKLLVDKLGESRVREIFDEEFARGRVRGRPGAAHRNPTCSPRR